MWAPEKNNSVIGTKHEDTALEMSWGSVGLGFENITPELPIRENLIHWAQQFPPLPEREPFVMPPGLELADRWFLFQRELLIREFYGMGLRGNYLKVEDGIRVWRPERSGEFPDWDSDNPQMYEEEIEECVEEYMKDWDIYGNPMRLPR